MSYHQLPINFSYRSANGHAQLRRILDFVLSAVSLIALAPVMFLIALAIFMEDAGPVFFIQRRLGIDGRPFGMFKFRKFSAACSSSGAPLTLDGDSRLTAIGKFLVITKLDELPQLWNVLTGDMAIVGPRPESMAFADCFKGGFEEILSHKPGLVGPSQVEFRHEAKLYPAGEDPSVFYRRVLFPAKARLDLDYFRHRTIGSDLALMLESALSILNIHPSLSKISGSNT